MLLFVVKDIRPFDTLAQELTIKFRLELTQTKEEAEFYLKNSSVRLLVLSAKSPLLGDREFRTLAQHEYGVPVVIVSRVEDFEGVNEPNSWDFAEQVLLMNVGPKILAKQIELAEKSAVDIRMLRDRHSAAIKNLKMQREEAKVINLYSHTLNVSYSMAHNLVRSYARRHQKTTDVIVKEHAEMIGKIPDRQYFESIGDVLGDPPLARPLRKELAKLRQSN